MESQAPWSLLTFALKAHGSVELDSYGQVPLQWSLVVIEPHCFIVIDQVLWCVLIKQGLHVHQNVEKVVFARGHYLFDKNKDNVRKDIKDGGWPCLT